MRQDGVWFRRVLGVRVAFNAGAVAVCHRRGVIKNFVECSGLLGGWKAVAWAEMGEWAWASSRCTCYLQVASAAVRLAVKGVVAAMIAIRGRAQARIVCLEKDTLLYKMNAKP